MKTDIYIEFNGKKTNVEDLSKKAKEIWKANGKRLKDLESVELYFKPEENKCYYVFDGKAIDDNYFNI